MHNVFIELAILFFSAEVKLGRIFHCFIVLLAAFLRDVIGVVGSALHFHLVEWVTKSWDTPINYSVLECQCVHVLRGDGDSGPLLVNVLPVW